jgi:DNA mismatch repair protein MutS
LADRRPVARRKGRLVPTPSILFPEGAGEPGFAIPQDTWEDLGLDRMVDAMIAAGSPETIRDLLNTLPADPAVVEYRQQIARDFEREAVAELFRTAVAGFAAVARDLSRSQQAYYRLQRDRWHLGAAEAYVTTVVALADGLETLPLTASGLLALREYVGRYVASPAFQHLRDEVEALLRALASVQYLVRIRGETVSVLPYQGEEDIAAELRALLEPVGLPPLSDLGQAEEPASPDLNHVEAQILEFVAQLHPDVFARLGAFREQTGTFPDPGLEAVMREVPYYLAYLSYIEPLKQVGYPFSYPEFRETFDDTFGREAFDVILARELVRRGETVVTNDWEVRSRERLFVVTGPNHGGKTTFARTVGQLHVLAQWGYPVPGVAARLPIVDQVLTHFPRAAHQLGHPGSQLEDDLVRLRSILERGGARSLILLNETLASTTWRDGMDIGRQVLQQLEVAGALAVWVTFFEDLAREPGAVSLVSMVGERLEPTYRIVRHEPQGTAYAVALARRFGLDYLSLKERIQA